MTSGAYPRRPCPGCGRKTLTPSIPVGVTEDYHVTASRCRSCGCSFARGLLVQGPGRDVTDEIRSNRIAALLADADDIEQRARDRLATAADMREAVARLLSKVSSTDSR